MLHRGRGTTPKAITFKPAEAGSIATFRDGNLAG